MIGGGGCDGGLLKVLLIATVAGVVPVFLYGWEKLVDGLLVVEREGAVAEVDEAQCLVELGEFGRQGIDLGGPEDEFAEVSHGGHGGGERGEGVATEFQPLEVGEKGDAVGEVGDTVAPEVEFAEVGHGVDLGRDGFETFVSETEDVDLVGVTDIVERLIDAIGLCQGDAGEYQKEENEV